MTSPPVPTYDVAEEIQPREGFLPSWILEAIRTAAGRAGWRTCDFDDPEPTAHFVLRPALDKVEYASTSPLMVVEVGDNFAEVRVGELGLVALVTVPADVSADAEAALRKVVTLWLESVDPRKDDGASQTT
jgi:hypothetical protein